MTTERPLVSRRLLDALAMIGIVGTILLLSLMTALVIRQGQQIARIQRQQISIVQDQNDEQICAQYNIIRATRSIARSLGLPTRNIDLPNIEGIDCAKIHVSR